jgi:hypothetical protein
MMLISKIYVLYQYDVIIHHRRSVFHGSATVLLLYDTYDATLQTTVVCCL